MFDVRRYDRIGSTNDEARRLAEEGAPHGTVVHADEQTAGRGRLARRWFSPPGNLYLSVLLREVPPERLWQLSFLSALAVADAVDALLPSHTRAQLKWPNDVLVGGAKISGILIEQAGSAVILGIGINVLVAPQGPAYPTTTLAASGGIATVDGACSLLLRGLEAWLARWTEGGFPVVREAWLARAHRLGETLHVATSGRSASGVFVGLDADGALLLDTDAGRVRIVAGDVGGSVAGDGGAGGGAASELGQGDAAGEGTRSDGRGDGTAGSVAGGAGPGRTG
ncbi:MAG: biotin--[acetyl-CoA-carboxylase] ligase [Rhodospirillales bacterium 69-11]|nr:biotin--[acetyl-CoA-carboxylase] ligase [Rhodospirillales bacterium]OJW24864.1 MAG: biotin--[acetyl-CoA-carboxylase] ligase [Rhodospirillales bacterium 69-11]